MDARSLGHITYRVARRVVVCVVGGTLLAIGLVFVFTPGPGVVVIGMGLGVLALEFAWARHWLRRLRETATETARNLTGNSAGRGDSGH